MVSAHSLPRELLVDLAACYFTLSCGVTADCYSTASISCGSLMLLHWELDSSRLLQDSLGSCHCGSGSSRLQHAHSQPCMGTPLHAVALPWGLERYSLSVLDGTAALPMPAGPCGTSRMSHLTDSAEQGATAAPDPCPLQPVQHCLEDAMRGPGVAVIGSAAFAHPARPCLPAAACSTQAEASSLPDSGRRLACHTYGPLPLHLCRRILAQPAGHRPAHPGVCCAVWACLPCRHLALLPACRQQSSPLAAGAGSLPGSPKVQNRYGSGLSLFICESSMSWRPLPAHPGGDVLTWR